MSHPRCAGLLIAILAAQVALASDESSKAGGAEPKIVSVAVSPASLELTGKFGRHGLLVSALDEAGHRTDVTAKAKFTIRDAPIARWLEGTAECLPLADGSTEITVEFNGQTAIVPVVVHNCADAGPPSFGQDVVPLLTRMGCNQGACHGKNDGRNGFRLSLRGYAPDWDFERLMRESRGRRVNLALPEQSLILQKATAAIPHGGGQLFLSGSREYELLLDWIKAAGPAPIKDEATVERVEILPGNLTLAVGQDQQLLVRAVYSDGRVRDVTWLTQFFSNDSSVVVVNPAGRVSVLRQGETAVRAHFQGQVAIAIFTVPFGAPIAADHFPKPNSAIDEHVFRKLASLGIPAADLCSDEAYLRRAMLDTIGTLPTPDEVRAFVADSDPNKRAQLVDRLMLRPEFVDYWALQLGDLLQNRKERDHDVHGTKGVRAFHQWIREQISANRPWDELVRDMLTVQGSTADHPELGYYLVNVGEAQEADKSEIVAASAQAFLGTRIGCAKCHNHPLEKYTQDDYYHFAAYFSRIKMERKEPKDGASTLQVSAHDANQNKQPIGVSQPRTGQFLTPQPLDRSPTTVTPGEDPRVKLAAWITDPKNDAFAGAMVNRLWQHFLGVGLVEPVDDLRASNPPSNPELMKALSQDFVAHKYDLRYVMRLILNSRTYQLNAATQTGNEGDTKFYSHYYARRLPAEVLLDAISQSTGMPEHFNGYPVGVRAMQLPEPGLDSYFLTQFGRSDRVTACACERRGEVTIPQLLQLENGSGLQDKVRAGEGRLETLLKVNPDDGQVVEELFLATLSRKPRPPEMAAVQAAIADAGNREEAMRDTFWALLNSKDFAFNH